MAKINVLVPNINIAIEATFAKKLEEDCRQEAIRPQLIFRLMERSDRTSTTHKVFVVHGLDKKKMKDDSIESKKE